MSLQQRALTECGVPFMELAQRMDDLHKCRGVFKDDPEMNQLTGTLSFFSLSFLRDFLLNLFIL